MESTINAKGSVTCKLCGTTDLRLAYKLGNNSEFRYFRCPTCQLINYDPNGALDQTQYAEVWLDPRVNHPAFRKANQTFEFLSRSKLKPGRMLEIGSGAGRVLHLAREAGWDVTGIELATNLAECTSGALGVPVHVMDFLEGDISSLGTFDLLTLAHVLEHLPDPVRAMERMRSLLKPGGHALLEFPNIDSIDFKWKRFLTRTGVHRKTFPEGWRPGHAQEFCRRSFGFLAKKTKFEVIAWQTYSRNPALSAMYRTFGIGNKVQVLARRTD